MYVCTVQDRNGVVIRGRLPSGAPAGRACAPLASLAAFVAPRGGPPRSNGLPPQVPGSYIFDPCPSHEIRTKFNRWSGAKACRRDGA